MHQPLVVDYYSDILCVWAWIAQRRIDELETHWGTQIEVRHHCVDVFGDVAGKIAAQWSNRGGYEGFAQHVRESAGRYEHVQVNAGLWERVRPATSANAHLVLKAVAATLGAAAMIDFAFTLRCALFIDASDIGRLDVVLGLAREKGLPVAALEAEIESGGAIAALLGDYQRAEARGIRGSPSWVLNEGRQILYGNVGYRVLDANVEELLRRPEQEASWC